MYPKLNPEPVYLSIGGKEYRTPRDKIAAAFAGAYAAKECLLRDVSKALLASALFKEVYDECFPECICAANQVGLSATVETLDYYNPATGINNQLKDRLEHLDNPFYPFFEED